jgi:hypothetical protein
MTLAMEDDMKYAILAALVLAACQTAVDDESISVEPGSYTIIETEWPAQDAFCNRHVNAARTSPEYLVDICIIECQLRPEKEWCDTLEEILKNDPGRNPTIPN